MKKFSRFLRTLFGAMMIDFLPMVLFSFVFVLPSAYLQNIGINPTYVLAGCLLFIYLYTLYSIVDNSSDNNIKADFEKREKALIDSEADIELEKQKLSLREKKVKDHENAIETILKQETQSFPWLAMIFAEYEYSVDMRRSKILKNKVHPAAKAAQQVSELAKEKKELIIQNKQLQYQLNFFESVFPWLEDFKKLPPKEAAQFAIGTDADYDNVRSWLSPEEYQTLSPAVKNQLALDRFLNRKRTDWEAGVEYERYIGYIYEQMGFRVQYAGATLGLEDMGRDLIAEKDGELQVIQCKRWSSEKTIHEKHVFQLYGSTVLLSLSQNKPVKSIFITTTHLSKKAKQCADYLGVQCFENYPLQKYPLIKCNKSRGGKIYHLPFDQQYDRVVIKPKLGEFYAWTVQEAEDAGFRRAYRWRGN